jgi:hypothetical protein
MNETLELKKKNKIYLDKIHVNLKKVDIKDIQNLSTITSPHQYVKNVFEILCFMRSFTPLKIQSGKKLIVDFWETSRRLIFNNPTGIKTWMDTYDKDKISEKIISKIEEFEKIQFFTVENLLKINKVSSYILKWIFQIKDYYYFKKEESKIKTKKETEKGKENIKKEKENIKKTIELKKIFKSKKSEVIENDKVFFFNSFFININNN